MDKNVHNQNCNQEDQDSESCIRKIAEVVRGLGSRIMSGGLLRFCLGGFNKNCVNVD